MREREPIVAPYEPVSNTAAPARVVSFAAAAFAALYRLKVDVLWVVLAGGLIGLARALLFG
jgi:hypothetical protein